MKTRHLTRAAYGLATAILGVTLMVGAPVLGAEILVGLAFFTGMVMTMGVLITWLVGRLEIQEPPAEVYQQTPAPTAPVASAAGDSVAELPVAELPVTEVPVEPLVGLGALQTSADADFLSAAGIARL